MRFFDNFKNKNLIIAHRGFRGINNENSLNAFKKSKELSDFIEFDIQFTKDYTPIVHHDETLKNLTDIKNYPEYKHLEPWYVKDFLFEEIKDIKFSGEKILKLKTFCKYAKKENIFFNLEIKKIHKDLDYIKCLQILYKLLSKYELLDKVLISSFTHNYLEFLYKIDKTLALSALDKNKKRKDIVNYLKKLNIQSYHVEHDILDSQTIKDLKEENIETLVFTVNRKKEIEYFFKLGVRGVYTDYPYK